VSTIAAIAETTPEAQNSPKMVRLTSMPENRAASRLLPMA
jgi:hypothetical protein